MVLFFLAKGLMSWNVTDESVTIRDVVTQEWSGQRSHPSARLHRFDTAKNSRPGWWMGSSMEDLIKAYYERQGVGDLYEQQIPKQ